MDLSDAAAVALDPALAASSFADAMEAVNGVSSPDAASSAAIVAPERMEGILSPISDRLEAFVLGTQDVFAKQGVLTLSARPSSSPPFVSRER